MHRAWPSVVHDADLDDRMGRGGRRLYIQRPSGAGAAEQGQPSPHGNKAALHGPQWLTHHFSSLSQAWIASPVFASSTHRSWLVWQRVRHAGVTSPFWGVGGVKEHADEPRATAAITQNVARGQGSLLCGSWSISASSYQTGEGGTRSRPAFACSNGWSTVCLAMQSEPPQAIAPALLADPDALGEAVVAGRIAFDDALIGAWTDRAGKPGVFRCSFADATRRRAMRIDASPGRFWVQCNPGRAGRRAPTVHFTAVSAPFDASAFHFAQGRIQEQEVLMRLRVHGVRVDVLINVSPLGGAHSLLVIDPEARRTQQLDGLGLGVAMAIAQMSRRADFKVGFNSLSACASVNHYHFHGLYFRGRGVDDDLMPSERAALASPEISAGFSELVSYPARGWCTTPQVRGGMVRAAGALASVLIQSNVAHNVVLSRERIVVIPRRHQSQAPEGVFPGLAFLEMNGEMLVVAEPRQQAEQIERAMTDEEVARQISAMGLRASEFESLREQALVAIERL